ncbi:uncharacterized protein AAGF69_013839 [Amazona ochrocephala]
MSARGTRTAELPRSQPGPRQVPGSGASLSPPWGGGCDPRSDPAPSPGCGRTPRRRTVAALEARDGAAPHRERRIRRLEAGKRQLRSPVRSLEEENELSSSGWIGEGGFGHRGHRHQEPAGLGHPLHRRMGGPNWSWCPTRGCTSPTRSWTSSRRSPGTSPSS